MNTKNMTQEQISAFTDGELPDAQFDIALAALREPDNYAKWNVYHQIGDVLRSDDMAVEMSPDFMARLSKRLDDEPTIIAPVTQPQTGQQKSPGIAFVAAHPARPFLLRGMAAAAAVAAIAFIATPQLMVASKMSPTSGAASMLASASQSVSMSPKAQGIARQEGEVLRDSGIDEYLLAHQRFSPSVYSTAQYARSATFAIDSDK